MRSNCEPTILITNCTVIHSNYWTVLASNCLWIRGAETSKGKLWNLHTSIEYGEYALATVANMKKTIENRGIGRIFGENSGHGEYLKHPHV